MKSSFLGNKYLLVLNHILTFHRCQILCTIMSYKLKVWKGISTLVGQMTKHEIENIFCNQNISKTAIYKTIVECKEGAYTIPQFWKERSRCSKFAPTETAKMETIELEHHRYRKVTEDLIKAKLFSVNYDKKLRTVHIYVFYYSSSLLFAKSFL